ncbi:chemotaxis protein histidine kinase CheA [Pseudarthrobacter sp. W1I19]|nr:chemotaxis protein histidine kinase CheA [Pseudarthrobacter sp. W1I19]
MNKKHHISRIFQARMKKSGPPQGTQQPGSTRIKLAATAGVAMLLLTGCGASSNSLAAVSDGRTTSSATATPTASPTPTPIAKTPCSPLESQRTSAGATYICTGDETGKQIWLEQSESKKLSEKIAAAAAAKAAAEKAAAEKAAADAAAAEAAAKAAAEAKAAEDAAAAQAAAAAAAKAAPAPAPAPAPPAPKYVAPAAPAAPSGCDPNYSGCVPVASDVDCAGGSGNGPAYVQGPVRVLGSDIYDLDRDSDGIGCEG